MKATHNNAVRSMSRGGIALPVFVACLLLAFSGLRAGATVLMADTFSDGNSTNQALPYSADWLSGGPTPNMSVSNGALTFRDANSGKATAVAYFTPTELEMGQSLKLSFNYSFTQTATANNDFMFGLYNSGGDYATKDDINFRKLANYTGFATSGVFGRDSSTAGLDHIELANQTGDNLLSLSDYTVGKSYIQIGAATPGEIYAASMQISRTAAGVVVKSQIGDTVMVQTYTNSMFTKFDTVGIFSNGDTGTFTLDNVQLDYVGAPEPSAFVAMMLFGVAVFGKMFGSKVRGLALRFSPRLSFCSL